MDNLLNETKFEEHIASYLADSDLYNQRSSAQFDIEKLCDVECWSSSYANSQWYGTN